jgi:hypothetical protein
MKKDLKIVGIEELFLSVIKAIYYKPIANIILDGKQPIKVKKKTGDACFPHSYSV